MSLRVILLHPAAPTKPAPASPCNGCGVCCAAEPCPVGQLLSLRRRGACAALQWQPDMARYVCGVIDRPGHWVPLLPAAWTQALARRWIAVGEGCDSDFQASAAPAPDAQADSTR